MGLSCLNPEPMEHPAPTRASHGPQHEAASSKSESTLARALTANLHTGARLARAAMRCRSFSVALASLKKLPKFAPTSIIFRCAWGKSVGIPSVNSTRRRRPGASEGRELEPQRGLFADLDMPPVRQDGITEPSAWRSLVHPVSPVRGSLP